MVQPANSSVSLASSRRPRNSRARWTAPAEYPTVGDARVVPKAPGVHRTLGAATVAPIPVKPAEVAQARVFEGLLQAESAELQELAHRIAGAVDQLPDTDGSAPSWDLMQIRARIDEVQSLLQALRGRFPHPLAEFDR
jgi:hypothetical protein